MDSVLFLEEEFQEKGRLEGFEAGRRRGYDEGKALGLERAFKLSIEVGYYIGFAETWLTHSIATDASPRLIKHLIGLGELARSFNTTNDLNEDPQALIALLRVKFKAVCSLAKTNQAFETRTSLTF